MHNLPFELAVASPCQQQWSELSGRGTVRHCSACERKVHDLEALTSRQIEALLVETNGDLCGRIRVREDRSVAHRASPRRGGTLAFVALTAITGSMTCAHGQALQEARSQPERDAALLAAAQTGKVADSSGALIVGALVTVTPAPAAGAGETTTNADGEFSLSLPRGEYRIQVTANGFAALTAPLVVSSEDISELTLVLKPGTEESVQVTAQLLDSATMGTLTATITNGPWYKRLGVRLRHPIAFTRYMVRQR
jgi:hypothetical protein